MSSGPLCCPTNRREEKEEEEKEEDGAKDSDADEGQENDEKEEAIGNRDETASVQIQLPRAFEEEDVGPPPEEESKKTFSRSASLESTFPQQRAIADSLFEKMREKMRERAESFEDFEVFMLVPDLNSLYKQTTGLWCRLFAILCQEDRRTLVSRIL